MSPTLAGEISALGRAAGNRAVAELLTEARRPDERDPSSSRPRPSHPTVQRNGRQQMVRVTIDGRTMEVTPAQFGRLLEAKLTHLDALVGALAETSRSYRHYRSGRGERATGRGLNAPREGPASLWESFSEGVNTAASYVSDIAGGTWQPIPSELTDEPQRHLHHARDALFSDLGLLPSTREGDWERAIRHMQRAEDAIVASRRRWNRYLDETQSGAERMAEGLAVVRDVSFIIVATIATGGAATIAEGVVAGALVAGLAESARQTGESIADPRAEADIGRLGTEMASGGVGGGMSAAVRPMGEGARRIGRAALGTGLSGATEETVRQAGETATGRRRETDAGRIVTTGLTSFAVGGAVEGLGSTPIGIRSPRRPVPENVPGSASSRERTAVPPDSPTLRAPGERTAVPPDSPTLRAPGERTAVPPQDPATFMRPIEPSAPGRADVSAAGQRWPGREPDLLEAGDLRPLTGVEADGARRLIDAGIDARYRIVPREQYENLYRRGGGEGSAPGFVDRNGVVILPRHEPGPAGPGSSAPGAGGQGAAPGAPSEGAARQLPRPIPVGAVRQLPPPAGIADVSDAGPAGRTAPRSRAPEAVPATAGGSRRPTSYREIGDSEARAWAEAVEGDFLGRPLTRFPRSPLYEQEFRAAFGPDAPLPRHGYVTDDGATLISPHSEAGIRFWSSRR